VIVIYRKYSIEKSLILLFFFILLSINISYSKTPEKKDFSLSYLLNVTDEHGKYTVHVYEYKSKDTYYRRDDWESENKGNVSYIIIKENNVSSYLIIHDMKKIYSLSRGTGVNTILEESWIGDLHLKLIEKEKLPPEKYEGYMCKKTRYINKETEESCTMWFSYELKRYLKVESSLSGFIFNLEMKEINTKPLDTKIFKLPEGYEIIPVDPKQTEFFPDTKGDL